MRLGIFVVMAGRQAGGVETYELGLVRALAAVDQQSEFHVFCTSPAVAAAFEVSQENFRFHVLGRGRGWLSIPVALPLGLRQVRPQLLHATYIPPLFSAVPHAFTVHDTSVFDHPEFYHRRHRWLLQGLQRTGLTRARLVVCVSKTTRDRVAERFAIPRQRLEVVYSGVDERFRPAPGAEVRRDVQRRFGIDVPYLLFVGQLRTRHKNLLRLLEAFHRFRLESRSQAKLVLAGKRSWTTEGLDEAVARLGLGREVVELGHVADADLPCLYRGAELLAFPSLSEGFGLSVLEAMACGTPVVASRLPALEELAGDAAVLVNPYSVDEIAEALTRVFSDGATRSRLREAGMRRAAQFTWRQTAEQMLAVYSRLAGERRFQPEGS